MELKIDKAKIESAIQEHLDRVVKEGIDYRVKEALNSAIAESITPEVVSSYTTAALQALTDPAVTKRIVTEMQHAIAEGVRMTMQEAIVAVAARLRGFGLNPSRYRDDEAKIQELRERLFPLPQSAPNNPQIGKT